jgi:hypothetical protein
MCSLKVSHGVLIVPAASNHFRWTSILMPVNTINLQLQSYIGQRMGCHDSAQFDHSIVEYKRLSESQLESKLSADTRPSRPPPQRPITHESYLGKRESNTDSLPTKPLPSPSIVCHCTGSETGIPPKRPLPERPNLRGQ